MTDKPDLRRYLEFESVAWPKTPQKGYAYRSPHHYLLQNGRAYGSAALTPPEAAYLARLVEYAEAELPPKHCFENAQRLAMAAKWLKDPCEVRYAEGLVATPGLPAVDHGWLIVNGKVVDPTLRFMAGERAEEQECLPGRPAGVLPAGRAYFGVEFEPDQVIQHLSTYKEFGTMVGDWWHGCPLLKLAPGEKQRRRGPAAGRSVPGGRGL